MAVIICTVKGSNHCGEFAHKRTKQPMANSPLKNKHHTHALLPRAARHGNELPIENMDANTVPAFVCGLEKFNEFN